MIPPNTFLAVLFFFEKTREFIICVVYTLWWQKKKQMLQETIFKLRLSHFKCDFCYVGIVQLCEGEFEFV